MCCHVWLKLGAYKLVGGFKHVLFSIIYGMSSFPLTNSYVSRWLKPPTSDLYPLMNPPMLGAGKFPATFSPLRSASPTPCCARLDAQLIWVAILGHPMDDLCLVMLSGWWFWTWLLFSIFWGCHHPNWRTHMFQRGRSTCWNHQPVVLLTYTTPGFWCHMFIPKLRRQHLANITTCCHHGEDFPMRTMPQHFMEGGFNGKIIYKWDSFHGYVK